MKLTGHPACRIGGRAVFTAAVTIVSLMTDVVCRRAGDGRLARGNRWTRDFAPRPQSGKLMTYPCPPVEDLEVDVVTMIASALREKFGSAAIAVAINQIAAVATDSAPVWVDVLARLRHLESDLRS
jgi:hypothetical protein